jgi:hypothetical protein
MEIQAPHQLFMPYVCTRCRYGVRRFLIRHSWFTNPFSPISTLVPILVRIPKLPWDLHALQTWACAFPRHFPSA